ncbi:tetratricopeptide repeat protein [Marinobacter koreensis]|uniref:Tetratricopeptide repeat protein n=1 Tax=Marinobacter koreensis TaxID=335974 RepID=A0ABW0RTN6_9GAMM|nr:tetratricopeptide repeat protein [Marinobacter koreensis]MCK7549098.1 tetratricopeptide repeat protein [Marinobacter koreensis]
MTFSVLGRTSVLSAVLVFAGCASGPGSIYVPVGEQPTQAPEPPKANTDDAPDSRVWRKSEQPDEPAQPETERDSSSPSYSASGDTLSPAALSLVRQADNLLASGDTRGAIARLERAQRIAPRSAEVYFKLSQAYVAADQLGSAEQFTLKGLSLAGDNARLQRAGWLLLADIRRARGNVAGADQAEARAAAL